MYITAISKLLLKLRSIFGENLRSSEDSEEMVSVQIIIVQFFNSMKLASSNQIQDVDQEPSVTYSYMDLVITAPTKQNESLSNIKYLYQNKTWSAHLTELQY